MTRRMRAPVLDERLPAWGAVGTSSVTSGGASFLFGFVYELNWFGWILLPGHPNQREALAQPTLGGL